MDPQKAHGVPEMFTCKYKVKIINIEDSGHLSFSLGDFWGWGVFFVLFLFGFCFLINFYIIKTQRISGAYMLGVWSASYKGKKSFSACETF